MSLVENIYFKQDDFKLEIQQWEIPDQGVTVLWGPSGSGKSTLFRILLGLENCPTLKWNFQDENLVKMNWLEKNFGVVFQTWDVFPHLTAQENILLPLLARNQKAADYSDRIQKIKEKFNMHSFWNRPAGILSGGEQQRVALARAIIYKPRFLFLDEPFSALDSDLRISSRDLVKELIQEEKIPCLLVTHDEQDVRILADRVFKLNQGRLI